MFIYNTWYIAAWDTELASGRPLARRLLDQPVVFYRTEAGDVFALADRCPHRAAPLSLGAVEADNLRCMYHGLAFDGQGQCVEVPGQATAPRTLKVRSYPVVERNHLIWIWMGDPARADPNLIYDSHWHDSDTHAWRGGYIHYEGNYQLIADNLLDFSHLAFVHHNSIGTRSQADTRATVSMTNEGAGIAFVTLGAPIPAFARALSTLPDIVDRFQYYSWRIKGCYFVQDSAIVPPGDTFESTDPRAVKIHTINVATPETAHTSHFFWSIAHSDFNPGDPDISSKLALQVGKAFEEDRAMIAAQSRTILEDPDAPLMAIKADNALVQVRRLTEQLIEEDRLLTSQLQSAFEPALA